MGKQRAFFHISTSASRQPANLKLVCLTITSSSSNNPDDVSSQKNLISVVLRRVQSCCVAYKLISQGSGAGEYEITSEGSTVYTVTAICANGGPKRPIAVHETGASRILSHQVLAHWLPLRNSSSNPVSCLSLMLRHLHLPILLWGLSCPHKIFPRLLSLHLFAQRSDLCQG